MHSFKRILKTVGIFLLMVCVLSVGFGVLYFQGECHLYQDAREREALSGSVELVACGASYMFFGFQPEVFDQGHEGVSYNLSGLRLTMEGRYELLRLELERNPIRTVLLEVSSDTLARTRATDGVEGDLQVLGRLTGKERLRYFFQCFSVSEYPAVYYDAVYRGIENAAALLKGNYQKYNPYLIRGYFANVQSGIYISPYFKTYYHTEHLEETVQQEDIDGLKAIAALCREHGAELILVDMPKTEFYNCKYDNHQFFHDWFAAFAAEEGISFYDFNLYKWKWALVSDLDSFGDETHLIDYGARRFSEYLADFLTRRERGEELSQEFYADWLTRDWACGYLD